ncbi:MAG: GIY-YIG nuclease family protein [Bacteroidia bacterium]
MVKAASHFWFVYMVECADGSIYTGITTNIKNRIEMHNAGLGAKYTRSRLPVKLLICWEHSNRSEATKREIEIKKLSRFQKLELAGKK